VRLDHLVELRADLEDRVERAARVLEDDADVASSNRFGPVYTNAEHGRAEHVDRAAADRQVAIQQADEGAYERGLAAA